MRQKKRAVKILAAVFACLLLCTGLLAVYVPQGETGAKQGDTIYSITNVPVDQVQAIAVSNDRAVFGLLLTGTDIELITQQPGAYSQSELRAFVYATCHLTGNQENKDLSDIQSYGFDTPLSRVTLILADGSEVNFAILRQSGMGDSYYLFSEEKQAIYLIPAMDAQLFLRSESDFLGHTLFPNITSSNYPQVESVTVTPTDGRAYTLVQQGGFFYLEQPIVQRVPAAGVMDQLLRPMSALYADNLVSQEQGTFPEHFELELKLRFDGQDYTARFADLGDGRMWMLNPADGTIYELESQPLSTLSRDYLQLMDKVAYSYSAGDLQSISATAGGQDVFYEISNTGQSISATANGHSIAQAEVLALVNALCAARIDRELFETPATQPVLRLVFTLRTGAIDVVGFLPTDTSGAYAVAINGVANFTTTQAAVSEITQAAFSYG